MITYETNNKYLMHYNKNHDKLGRFSKGHGVGSVESAHQEKNHTKKKRRLSNALDSINDVQSKINEFTTNNRKRQLESEKLKNHITNAKNATRLNNLEYQKRFADLRNNNALEKSRLENMKLENAIALQNLKNKRALSDLEYKTQLANKRTNLVNANRNWKNAIKGKPNTTISREGNQELRNRIERIELQQRYKQAVSRNNSSVLKRGASKVGSILAESGGRVAGTLLTGAGIYLGASLVAKKAGENEGFMNKFGMSGPDIIDFKNKMSGIGGKNKKK